MSNKQEPNWQPISNLPMIAGMIDGQAAEAKVQYASLMEVRCKPHALDNHTIQRITKVLKEQQEFLWIYEKQLSKWQNEGKLSPAQQREITQLQVQVKEWGKAVTDILSLAEELKIGTIEKAIWNKGLN